ncbi:MAG: RteC domain-containing protein [Crocinitomicaceae bacterium]|nr:RteC domain-containing protein [Crocinitomicaceae bacterium]
MEKYFNKLKERLDKKTEKISKSNQSEFEKNEQCKMILLEHYNELHRFEAEYSFKSEREEIHYFKFLKPQILSELMFYNKLTKMIPIFQIECIEIREKRLDSEYKKIADFHENNSDFISYMMNGQTFRDATLFLRKNVEKSVIPSYLLLRKDANQITNGGHLVVKYLMYRKLQKMIIDEKEKLTQHKASETNDFQTTDLNWTNSKSDLVEMIYSLHLLGAINNGNTDIKEIVNEFERIFKIDLGDPYRHFTNIKQRQKSPTYFLEQLTENMHRIIENKQFKARK